MFFTERSWSKIQKKGIFLAKNTQTCRKRTENNLSDLLATYLVEKCKLDIVFASSYSQNQKNVR